MLRVNPNSDLGTAPAVRTAVQKTTVFFAARARGLAIPE
jgi:hypothetical protein